MSARRNVVWCPQGHRLAWLEADDGQAVVVVRAIAPGRDARTVGDLRVSTAALLGENDEDGQPYATSTVTAGCGCGRFSVDLVAVMEGRGQRPARDTTDYRDLGVSFDR